MAAPRSALVRLACLVCCLGSAAAFVPPASGAVGMKQLQRHAVAATPIVMGGAPTKPMRVNERNRVYNKNYRSEMRTRIKRVFEAVEGGDYGEASTALSTAFKIIDKNVKRNILHKNNAARKKSQMHAAVKGLEGGSAPAE